MPNTPSPGLSETTPLPTLTTRPAKSNPGIRSFGRRSPKPAMRTRYGRPAEVPDAPVHAGGLDLDQHFAVGDLRQGFVDFHPQDFPGRAELVLYDGLHRRWQFC